MWRNQRAKHGGRNACLVRLPEIRFNAVAVTVLVCLQVSPILGGQLPPSCPPPPANEGRVCTVDRNGMVRSAWMRQHLASLRGGRVLDV